MSQLSTIQITTSVSSRPATMLIRTGPQGKSSYQSYLDTTQTDPPLSEEEWSAIRGNFYWASSFGASPSATAAANVTAIQAALDAANSAGGGEVVLDVAGVYEMNARVIIRPYTEMRGVNGVTLKKTGAPFGELIINEGAATRTVDPGITLRNFTVDVNNNDVNGASYGMYGIISLYHVSDIVLEDIHFINVGSSLFAIHLCRFERLSGYRLSAVGGRDCTHLGPGHDFMFVDCRASTYDDFFGAQPADYPGISPETGDIYDGLLIRCRYDAYPSQAGFFWRSVNGAWTDWAAGEVYLKGRRCVNAGKVYVCTTSPVTLTFATTTTRDALAAPSRFIGLAVYVNADSKTYQLQGGITNGDWVEVDFSSVNAPIHSSGSETGVDDDLVWRFDHTGTDTSANCYNITLIDCHNYGTRQMIFASGEDVGSNYQITPGQELNAWMDNITVIGGSNEPSIAAPFSGGAGWIKRMSVSNFTMSDNTTYPYYGVAALGYTKDTDPRSAHVTELDFTNCRTHGPWVYAFRPGLNIRIRVTNPTADSEISAWPKTDPNTTGTVTITGDIALDANSESHAEGDEVIGYIYTSGAWTPKVATTVNLFGRTVSAYPMDPCRYQMNPGTTATSGTGSTAVVLDDERDLTAGTTATGYATCRYRTTWQTFNATSGNGINFDYPFTFAGRHIGCPEAAGNGVFRFLVGGPDAAPSLSTADAFTTKGIGIEFGIDAAKAAARLIYHNGTSYVEGDWVDLGISPAATLNVAWAVSSLGNGTCNLYVAGASSAWPTLPSTASDTVANGPTGLQTGQTDRFIGYAVVADGSTTPVANNTRALVGPILADFTTP